MDYQVFQAINHLAVTCSFLNPIMAFAANDLDYVFYIGVVVYWFTRKKEYRTMVIQALVSAVLALGTNKVIGSIYHRDRPFVHHHVIQLVQHEASASFPSNHAAASFAVAMSIWLWRKKDGRVWFILGAFLGFSRVWCGIHYPTDIVGGAILGSIIGVIVHKLISSWTIGKNVCESVIRIYETIEYKIWKPKQQNHSV